MAYGVFQAIGWPITLPFYCIAGVLLSIRWLAKSWVSAVAPTQRAMPAPIIKDSYLIRGEREVEATLADRFEVFDAPDRG